MDRQSNSHMKNGIASSPRKNVGKDKISPRKTAVPQHAATIIPDNSLGLRKYIIYEKQRDQSNSGYNNTNVIPVNNNVWLGENIDRNPRNQAGSENNKTEAVKTVTTAHQIMEEKEENGDAEVNMEEEDDEDDMTWPELFAWQLKDANGGGLIKEEDVPMIYTNNKELLKEYIDFKK